MTISGKKGIIMGVANNRSIATGIGKTLQANGAEIGYSYLPDKTGKSLTRIQKALEGLEPAFIAPCDVNQDDQIENFFNHAHEKLGQIDFLVHSIAFAPLEDIRCPTLKSSRQGFLTAMESSAYSLIATSRAASSYMTDGGSIITLSYYGSEKVIPGYNLMGVAKSALDASCRYLSHDLGSNGIRVNSISAGPIKTLAASAVSKFSSFMDWSANQSPLRRNVSAQDVGNTALFLVSDLSSAMTGENLHVDSGYHVMGGPNSNEI